MKTMITIVVLLLSVSQVFAAANVKLYSDLEFSDKSIQQRAYNLPTCVSGEVYVNKAGSLFCGSLMPIDRGIAICVSGACSLSACMQGYGDCDGNLTNGCEAVVGTIQNCSCGISCTPINECQSSACLNGACQFTYKTAGTVTSLNLVGNCQKNICNGAGSLINIIDNSNIPVDGNECTQDLCTNGMASNPASATGTYCSGIGFGGTCNGAGQCIPSVVCGDGVIGAGEQCDDGNTNNGDGCSSTCLLELPALVVSGFPSPVANNVSGSITVTAKNANNLNAVGYTGTVHFTSNDPSATLPANYTFTLMDGGVRVFSGIKFVTSGSRSITVTDINNAGVTGTQNITVLP